MAATYQDDGFDLKLAVECSIAFSDSTGLGCTVSDTGGKVLHEVGYGCNRCGLCAAARRDRIGCMQAHAYGMTEAERFGGKYIYFCPMGLTCFVSPIVGQTGSAAKITVGPFLMVELEDYIAADLRETLKLGEAEVEKLLPVLESIPYVSPGKVNSLSNILFMAVGFMNNVSAANRMLDSQVSESMQGQISEYILELKGGEELPQYPFDTERDMLASIAASDKPKAQKLLNELLGHILFFSGGDFARIKSRIYELLVIISRAAVEAGASPEQAFQVTHDFFQRTQPVGNIDDLCFMLAKVMNQFIDSIFSFADVKNVDVIHKALRHIRQNYAQKITLDEVAEMVHLSPSYFSKVFKKEMGCNFNTYINRLRIEKSRMLLLHKDMRLVDIATAVGFEDQSYFTKVFKRMTGISPHQYRKSGGRIDKTASGAAKRNKQEETKCHC